MSTRRQYSSCDQCRRSKRRCVFPPETSDTCINCSGLGRHCTSDFATAHAGNKEKRTKTLTRKARLQPGSESSFDLALGQGESNASNHEALDIQMNQTILPSESSIFDESQFFCDIPGLETSQQDLLAPRLRLPTSENGLSGFWSGSPIQILNSRATVDLLGTCLDDTYKSMMYGMESRYLAKKCNPFASDVEYRFEIEDGPHQSSAVQVTMAGVAHFLDHFGHLYGNKLTAKTRKEDESVLLTTQQAFALQWMSCDSPGSVSPENTQIFTTAWFNARSLIQNIINRQNTTHRSFTLAYAMLLFHMTNIPEPAGDVTIERVHILQQGLQQISDLKGLVDKYCHQYLDPTSTYRMLLETSTNILIWLACIKDTIASMITPDRHYVLPDAFCMFICLFSC